MSDYVYVSDVNYGDYIYYNGSTWVVEGHNVQKGTVTIRDLGGRVYKEISEYTLVERDE